MAQRWKTVPRPGIEYEVAASGKVRSIDRILPDGRRCGGQVLTPTVNSRGYPVVSPAAAGTANAGAQSKFTSWS